MLYQQGWIRDSSVVCALGSRSFKPSAYQAPAVSVSFLHKLSPSLCNQPQAGMMHFMGGGAITSINHHPSILQTKEAWKDENIQKVKKIRKSLDQDFGGKQSHYFLFIVQNM